MPKVYFSPLNTVAMRPVLDNRPDKYHRGHLDSEWQKNLILSFQYEAEYLQKVERGDRFRFVFDATDNAAQTVKIIDCNGLTILTVSQTATEDIAGNITANSEQFHTYLYKLSNHTALTEDGVYYLLVDVDGQQYISHPFLVKDEHENTLLIEYTHTENTQGTYFEQLPTRFPLRVEAYIDKMEAVSSDTVYEDQAYNLEQLDSTPYRSWTLFVGQTGEGIPDWMLDKLNRIFSLDTVYLDGKQYVKGSGAKWTKEGAGVLYAASIEIREADNTEGFGFGGEDLLLYEIPAYPFAVHSILIGKNSPSMNMLGGFAYVIEDGTDHTAFVAALNAYLSTNEMSGTVAVVSGSVYYQNGADEDYNAVAATIYEDKFTVTVESSQFSLPQAGFEGASAPALVVDWGDGTVQRTVFGGAFTTFSHTYTLPLAASYDIDIWGPISSFKWTDTAMIAFGGVVPALTQLIIEAGAVTSDTWDMDLLLPAADTLKVLTLTGMDLTAVTNYDPVFTVLRQVDFSNNVLGNGDISGIAVATEANAAANSLFFGDLSVSGQTPTATFDTSGALAEYSLTNTYGWGVNS